MPDLKIASGNPYVAYAAAALVGIAIGLSSSLLFRHSGLRSLVASRYWPKQGIVIYCRPTYAGISIVDSRNRTVTLGKTSANGSLSLNDLPAGKYTLTIEAAEYKPHYAAVDLSTDKPATIGYRDPISLQQNAADKTDR